MAKKSSGAGWAILIVIGAIAAVPKDVWIAVVAIAAVVYIIYVVFKKQSSTPPASEEKRSNLEIRTEPIVSVRFGAASAARPKAGVTSVQCWVPPGQSASVAGVRLPDGMVYIGSGLAAVNGYDVEPALIDPSLPVRGVDPAPRMPYWPSYSTITPEARGEYLHWLRTGRRNPHVQLGCVFLFLYGLERRALHDVKTLQQAVSAEMPTITTEVERLLSIYGDSGSFHGYASSFIELVKGRPDVTGKLYERSPPASSGWRRLQLAHKLALGQLARDGVPLPSEWAYSWLMHDEMTCLRTPAERCPDEFKRLFMAMYREKYATGMKLPINKTRLRLLYRPASASFGNQIELESNQLPDVTVLERPIEQLRTLANNATAALDPYSRFIGRNPEKRETLDALVLLPPLLWPDDSIESLRAWLSELGLERGIQATSLAELMRHFPAWGTMSKERAAAFAAALEHFGIGMEPDVRWGGPTPADSSPVVLFAISAEERGKKPSTSYSAAALTLHLAAGVSSADGISHEEEQYLESSVGHFQLDAHERVRLNAYVKWLLLAKPSFSAMKKRVAELDVTRRAAIAEFAVNAAHIEGGLGPAEMKVLAKVYRLLELPEGNLYRDAHAATTEPVTVSSRSKAVTRFTVPPKPARTRAPTDVALDADRIARLKEDSARVSAILGEIFTDDQQAFEAPEETTKTEPTLAGLDIEHSHFAQVLISRGTWSRAELEDLASDRGIMLDGALERVNEAFVDTLGEALLEGHDPVEVNMNVLKEIQPA